MEIKEDKMELKDKNEKKLPELNLVYEPVDHYEKLDLNNEVDGFNELIEKSKDELEFEIKVKKEIEEN